MMINIIIIIFVPQPGLFREIQNKIHHQILNDHNSKIFAMNAWLPQAVIVMVTFQEPFA